MAAVPADKAVVDGCELNRWKLSSIHTSNFASPWPLADWQFSIVNWSVADISSRRQSPGLVSVGQQISEDANPGLVKTKRETCRRRRVLDRFGGHK
jgi:hypothetical protein